MPPEPRLRRSVRDRLAARLLTLGWTIAPGHKINGALGWYRVNQGYDDTIVTWETWAIAPGQYFAEHLVSYDTMTACARGATVTRIGGVWWVHAIAGSTRRPR
jgi:hypothetical protein